MSSYEDIQVHPPGIEPGTAGLEGPGPSSASAAMTSGFEPPPSTLTGWCSGQLSYVTKRRSTSPDGRGLGTVPSATILLSCDRPRGARGTRTLGLLPAREALFRLSYSPKCSPRVAVRLLRGQRHPPFYRAVHSGPPPSSLGVGVPVERARDTSRIRTGVARVAAACFASQPRCQVRPATGAGLAGATRH